MPTTVMTTMVTTSPTSSPRQAKPLPEVDLTQSNTRIVCVWVEWFNRFLRRTALQRFKENGTNPGWF